MNLATSVLDIASEIERTKNKADLARFLEKTLSQFGVERLGVIELVGSKNRLPINWTPGFEDWNSHYFGKNYRFHDPIVRSLLDYGTTPKFWSDIEQTLKSGSQAWRVMNEGREFGFGMGVTFPIPGSDGYLAAITAIGPVVAKESDDCKALDVISTYIYRQLLAFEKTELSEDKVVQLTRREKECVHWLAEGKTYWDIGEILSVSQNTVRRHCENVKEKYGVSSRTQTVVEAIRRGDLLP